MKAPDSDLKAVIFDLDGVIFDSRQANIEFYNHLLEYVGMPPDAAQSVEVIHRENMTNSLKYLMGEGEKFDKAMAYWQTMDYSVFIPDLRLFPHVEEALEELDARFDLAVGTNRTKTANHTLKYFGLDRFFPLVVTPLEAQVSKPDSVFMQYILSKMGLSPDQVVYVGDSILDEKLCLDAGVRLVAFANPELEAWAHVDSHKEILELFPA